MGERTDFIKMSSTGVGAETQVTQHTGDIGPTPVDQMSLYITFNNVDAQSTNNSLPFSYTNREFWNPLPRAGFTRDEVARVDIKISICKLNLDAGNMASFVVSIVGGVFRKPGNSDPIDFTALVLTSSDPFEITLSAGNVVAHTFPKAV